MNVLVASCVGLEAWSLGLGYLSFDYIPELNTHICQWSVAG